MSQLPFIVHVSNILGCEEVIRQHFRLQHKAVLKQCSEWLHESDGGDEEKKLRRVIDELRSELKELTDDEDNKEVDNVKNSTDNDQFEG